MAVFTAIGAALFGAGTFFAGATAFVLQTVAGLGVSLIAKAIAGKPQGPSFSVSGKLQAGGDVPRSFLVGYAATAGSLVYANTWGNAGKTPNAYVTQVIALSDLPCQSLEEIWVNGELCTLADTPHASRGYPVLEYRKGGVDYLWIKFYDGTQSAADTFLTGTVSSAERPYEATRVGIGVAYVICTARINEELFTGFPAYRFALTGIPLYDISKDTTAGGSGSQAWASPASWGGDGDFLPAVQIYNLLRGITWNGEWFYGLQGVAGARLPAASWIAEIAKCRAVSEGPDGNEPTYRTGGEIQVGAEIGSAIEAILTGCQGRLAEIGGSYEIHVGAPGEADFAFTDDDILSTEEQSFTPFFGLADTITGIAAKYPNPAEGWNTKVAPPLYRDDLEELAGNRRLLADVSLDLVPYSGQVQRLMKSALAEAQRARRHTLVLPPKFWAFAVPNAICSWTSPRNGYVTKLFRVDGVIDRGNLDIVIDITEVDPEDYDWDQNVDYTEPVDGPVGPVRPPPQEMTGWSVAPYTITANGVERPSIEVSFDGDLDDVQSVRVQARLSDTLAVVFDGTISYGEPDASTKSVVLNGSFLPVTDYQVRGRFLPFSARDTEWSEWLSVTTPDTRVTEAELSSRLDAMLDQLRIGVQASLATRLNDLMAQIEILAATQGGAYAVAEQSLNSIIGVVGQRVGTSEAQIVTLQQATATQDSALAAFFVGLLAITEDGEATTKFRMLAGSGAEGAAASVSFEVRAEFGDEWSFGGLSIEAGAFENGATSRVLVTAGQFYLIDPMGGTPLPLHLVTVPAHPVVTPIADGEIQVDLTTHCEIYRTEVDDDAVYRMPIGAQPGLKWHHLLRFDGAGHEITFVEGEIFATEPTFDNENLKTNIISGIVMDTDPPRMWLKFEDSGFEEGPPPLAFVDDFTKGTRTLNPMTEAGGNTGEWMTVIANVFDYEGDGIDALSVAGWTLHTPDQPSGNNADFLRTLAYSRRLNGTENFNVNFSNAHTLTTLHVLRFSGGIGIASGDYESVSTTGNPATQTINVTGANVPMIALAIAFAHSAINPLTMSPEGDYDSGSLEPATGMHHRVKFKLFDEEDTPENVTADMDDEGLAQVLTTLWLSAGAT